ncbi:MAG: hypothetical protein QGG53_06990 [Planctomycetota bacterium]|jgi:hypothetical protein|nr:hypothetical protein [Planctomycetota bacterium]
MTFRSVFVGIILSLVLGLVLPVTEFLIQGTRLGLSSATPAAFFLLFVLLSTAQPLLKYIKPSWALRPPELLVVFSMAMVATVVPTRGFGGPYFGMSVGASYYSDDGNQWDKTIRPHLPDPIVVTDKEVVRQMYEGLDEGASLNWKVWLPSLAWWCFFMVVMMVTVLSVMLLFRRAWIQDERISFPVAQVAVALVEEGPAGSCAIALFYHPAFWVGFLLSAFLSSAGPLNNYFPETVSRYWLSWGLRHDIPFVDRASIRINLLMFGFAFFIAARVSFSLWFFYLLTQPLQWIYGTFFPDHGEKLSYWTSGGPHGTILARQQVGAMIVLVVGMIWSARKRILDQKGTLLLFAVGACSLCFMIHQTGVPLGISPVVVGGSLIIWLCLTRLMAQAGTATMVTAIVPVGFVVATVGVPSLGVTGLIGVGLTFIWAGDMLTYLMGPTANAVYLQHRNVASPNRGAFLLVVAVMVSLVACICMTLYLTHSAGALNLHPQYFNTFSKYPWKFVASKLSHGAAPPVTGFIWTGVGAGVMLLLTCLQRAFYWWPLHPLGYMAQGGWAMKSLWFSFFLAWLIKVLVLKYGGGAAYKKARVFFIGIITGLLVVGGLWLVVDAVTGMRGSRVGLY